MFPVLAENLNGGKSWIWDGILIDGNSGKSSINETLQGPFKDPTIFRNLQEFLQEFPVEQEVWKLIQLYYIIPSATRVLRKIQKVQHVALNQYTIKIHRKPSFLMHFYVLSNKCLLSSTIVVVTAIIKNAFL